jgi:hypothetical protein
MQRKQCTRYSREFKLEAVRQAALGEKPEAQIARAPYLSRFNRSLARCAMRLTAAA